MTACQMVPFNAPTLVAYTKEFQLKALSERRNAVEIIAAYRKEHGQEIQEGDKLERTKKMIDDYGTLRDMIRATGS